MSLSPINFSLPASIKLSGWKPHNSVGWRTGVGEEGFFFLSFFFSLEMYAQSLLLKSRDKHVLCGPGRAAERSPDSQSQLSKCIPETWARRKNVRAVISEQLQVTAFVPNPAPKNGASGNEQSREDAPRQGGAGRS